MKGRGREGLWGGGGRDEGEREGGMKGRGREG